MKDEAMSAALAAKREGANNDELIAQNELDALIKNQLLATQTQHGEQPQFQLDQGDHQFIDAQQSILSQDEALLQALHLQNSLPSSGGRDFSDDTSMESSSNRSVPLASESQTAAQMEAALLKQIVLKSQLQQEQEREKEIQRQLHLARLALLTQQQKQQIKLPDEHFIRVSCNGSIILGATKTITGVNPNNLLMASFYQDVHYDDLRGLRAIQKRYWMKGSPSVTCYLRRQTVDNDWVWVKSSVVSFIDEPVPGFVVQEVRETDEEGAYVCARLIKIVSILMEAIEEAVSFQEDCVYKKNANLNTVKNNAMNNPFPIDSQNQNQQQQNLEASDLSEKVDPSTLDLITGLKDDAMALEALIAQVESSGDTSMPQAMKQIIKTAVNGNNAFPCKTSIENDTESNSNDDKDKKTSEEVSILKLCRKGPNLALARMDLTPAEFKLIILVLVGKLTRDKLGPLVMEVVESKEKDLALALDGILLDIEEQQLKQQEQQKQQKQQKLAFEQMQNNLNKQGKKRGSSLQSIRDYVSRQENLSQSHNMLNSRFLSTGNHSNYKQVIQRKEDNNYFSSNSTGSLKSAHRNSTISNKVSDSSTENLSRISLSKPTVKTPWISVINLSNSLIGNFGMEMFAQVLSSHTPALKTLDLSFCRIDEKGIISFCRALKKRKLMNLNGLQGLILSGNRITYRSAKELGIALSSSSKSRSPRFRKRNTQTQRGGYEEDDDSENGEEDDDDFENDILFGNPHDQSQNNLSRKNNLNHLNQSSPGSKERQNIKGKNKILAHPPSRKQEKGLQLLHLGSTSLCKDGLLQILLGLGPDCQLRELAIPSNNISTSGVTLIGNYLEGKYKSKKKIKPGHLVMPALDRLDLSNNNLGNDGTAKLTRAISKRGKNVSMVDLHVSHNEIGSGGIETIMNKLLQQKLVVLSLDNNVIADRGCQLVAASLPSMHHLSRLNLSFNQIGSRGVTSLMRGLSGCESITYLGLSGNVMKISGAIAMGFALAHHPRLAELDLDNCCLSQVSQCHIVAGIISNRWVPMQTMNGFWAGPPMVAIGALDSITQDVKNEDCFRIRRDVQMKTILKASPGGAEDNSEKENIGESQSSKDFLSVDFVRTGSSGATSQSAYLRMLDWLSRIPFDEEELNYLQRYFYDADFRGDGIKSSEGNLEFLKHRGDLLAALGSGVVADEIRENNKIVVEEPEGPSVGLILDSDDDGGNNSFSSLKNYEDGGFSIWKSFKQLDNSQKRKMTNSDSGKFDTGKSALNPNSLNNCGEGDAVHNGGKILTVTSSISTKKQRHSSGSDLASLNLDTVKEYTKGSVSSLSKQSMSRAGSECSARSTNSKGEPRSGNAAKARIGMFPQFAANLDLLKASAQEMMDNEIDSNQQDIIAQQFAEASLTLLRQLRYHCMNSGLDGWRQGKIVRKVLIVDDSKVTRKIVARAFEKANFIVDTAENGVEGVGKLKKSIYDIAFMDIDMPVMNGFDATKALRDWEDVNRPGARQPICALTAAYVDDFERSELMKFKEAGLDVMESKPCNIPRLFKVVDDVSPMFSDLSISVTQNLDSSFLHT